MSDKHQSVEEPDASKEACPVLKTSRGGDKPAEFNYNLLLEGISPSEPTEGICQDLGLDLFQISLRKTQGC
jgi:hypothetical protein